MRELIRMQRLDRIRQLEQQFSSRAQVLYATSQALETHAAEADLLIGAVLIPGAADSIKKYNPFIIELIYNDNKKLKFRATCK